MSVVGLLDNSCYNAGTYLGKRGGRKSGNNSESVALHIDDGGLFRSGRDRDRWSERRSVGTGKECASR